MNERGRRYLVAGLVHILSGRDWPKYRAEAANAAARRMTGLVTACSIVNAKSGLCGEDCAFCAQSSHSRTGAAEYPLLDAESIVRAAEVAESRGSSRFGIVTSGLTLTGEELKVIAAAIGEIRKRTSLSADASLGVLS
ncbi:MAG: biotin synthase BioB, partial [Candidatus Brocadiia bacterium]